VVGGDRKDGVDRARGPGGVGSISFGREGIRRDTGKSVCDGVVFAWYVDNSKVIL
jgi:hypothetical protein